MTFSNKFKKEAVGYYLDKLAEQEGYPLSSCAKQFKVSENSLREWVMKYAPHIKFKKNKIPTPQQREDAVDELVSGVSVSKIAYGLGVTSASIYNWRKRRAIDMYIEGIAPKDICRRTKIPLAQLDSWITGGNIRVSKMIDYIPHSPSTPLSTPLDTPIDADTPEEATATSLEDLVL